MQTIQIRQGRNILLKGAARVELKPLPLPPEIAVPFFEFRPNQFRLLVQAGDAVQVGSPLAAERLDPRIVLVSPVSGIVKAVNRGDKRALLSISMVTDGQQATVNHSTYSFQQIAALSRDAVVERLLTGGVWPFIRQRPFAKIARPDDTPKSVFVHAMNTDPLAANIDLLLAQQDIPFQAGLDTLRVLTHGPVFLCFDAATRSKVLTGAKNVELAAFRGPHPAGNVGTHIHHLDPLGKSEVVWFVEAEDVVRIGNLFLKGIFDPRKTVAVTGEGAANRVHWRTIIGAPVSFLLNEAENQDFRYICGSVLSGTEVGYNGNLGLYDSQLTVIPAGGQRSFLGWMNWRRPGLTFSRTIPAGFVPPRAVSLDTDLHGGQRAIVVNNLYDDLNALDILPYFLIKAIYARQIEEMMRLGIFECAPEDFALCTFACPSKVDVGDIIRQGLALLEEEG